ncbi:alpha/beta fold hydrolase [Streptomyces sp. NPDC060002]|uniref:alpha/beta fold hydrolase n=1 Tax=Streptomyces sp. NPDC060002 TaxID=3347033 RepID=UPI003682CDD6
MELPDITTRTIRTRGLIFEAETHKSPSPRTSPVLAIRAGGEGESTIRPQRRALLPVADVIGVRITGVSRPGDLPPDCTLNDIGDGLAVLLDELGLPRVNILGTSHAGEIAYRFAVRHPDRTDHVVLTGANGHPPELPAGSTPASIAARVRVSRHDVAEEVIARVLCMDPERPVRGRTTLRWVLNDLFHGAEDDHINQWTGCIQMLCAAPPVTGVPAPLLVVTGEHDIAIRPGDSRTLAAMSSQAVFATIHEADHWVVLTHIREHLDLTRRFLLDEPLEDLPYLAELERFPRQDVAGPQAVAPAQALAGPSHEQSN